MHTNDEEHHFSHNIKVEVCPTFPKVSGESLPSESGSTSSEESGSNERVNIEEVVGALEGQRNASRGPACTPENEESDPTNVKFAYRASTWSKEHSTFHPEPREFTRESAGTTNDYFDVPTFMHLFRKFWPWDIIRKIRDETNHYAGSLDENGRPHGHDSWYPTTVAELQVYLSISLYMGMKWLPNVKAYWAKLEPFFYCSVIGRLLT
jgi:hypothetical protein